MLDLKRWDKTPGWFNQAEGQVLYDLIYDLPEPGTIVEIGCFRGKSTIAMLQACADSSPKRHKTVISVDPFDGGDGSSPGLAGPKEREKLVAQFYNNISEFGLKPWLMRLDVTTSDEWFSDCKERGTFDYAAFFIDGWHQNVAVDMLNAWPLLREGGILICHDYDPANMQHFMIKLIDGTGIPGKHCGQHGTALWVAEKR